MYWRESLQARRRVSVPVYRRRQSSDAAVRRTLPAGTLLLVHHDDSDVTGCDVILALDRQGSAFYVPLSSLRRCDDSASQQRYYPTPLSPHQATVFIAAQRQKGCFIVYKPALEETLNEGRQEYVLAVGLSEGKY